MVVFTCNEGLTTIQVVTITCLSCRGNDINDSKINLHIIGLGQYSTKWIGRINLVCIIH